MNYTKGSKAAMLIARLAEAKENISALQELWLTIIGEPVPDPKQCMIWLTRHNFDVVSESISDLANWVSKHGQLLEEDREKFAKAKTKYQAIKKPTTEQTAEYNNEIHKWNEAIRLHHKGRLDLLKYVSGIMKWKEVDKDDPPKKKPVSNDDDDVVSVGEGFKMDEADDVV
jgi:DNA-binding protein H-NS